MIHVGLCGRNSGIKDPFVEELGDKDPRCCATRHAHARFLGPFVWVEQLHML